MAEVLGEEAHIQWYEKRMVSMKIAFEKEFWKEGFYSSDSEKFKDDRANAIAIVSGIANPEYYNKIVDNVLIPNKFSSPHFEWIAEEAMCIAGRHKEALQRMKEQYQSQVDKKEMTTLYEMFPNGGSYNHAWNAPNTILSKYIAGIVPTKEAWTEYQIMPTLLHFTHLRKTIPTVMGEIKIDMKKTDSTYTLNLKSPDVWKTTVIVGIPKAEKEISKVEFNGVLLWEKGKANKAMNSGVFEDDKFLKFRLTSQNWNIKATYK